MKLVLCSFLFLFVTHQVLGQDGSAEFKAGDKVHAIYKNSRFWVETEIKQKDGTLYKVYLKEKEQTFSATADRMMYEADIQFPKPSDWRHDSTNHYQAGQEVYTLFNGKWKSAKVLGVKLGFYYVEVIGYSYRLFQFTDKEGVMNSEEYEVFKNKGTEVKPKVNSKDQSPKEVSISLKNICTHPYTFIINDKRYVVEKLSTITIKVTLDYMTTVYGVGNDGKKILQGTVHRADDLTKFTTSCN